MKGPVKRVAKPWGHEIWYAQAPRYVGKILVINKGHRLSRQYHRFKHETLYADRGRFILELNGRRRLMKPGTAVVVRPGDVHRMHARFEDVRIIEVSTPQLKDVVRLEDDYGR